MNWNIDATIIALFLAINLCVGLYYGKGIKTIREYAIGDRNFSTATIAATITATWISGSFFAVNISETYKEGLWFFIAGFGEITSLLIIGYILGPRLREFFGSLSVAESMGELYGKKARIITAICSIAQAIGMTALQIKVFSSIFSHFLDMSSLEATLISSFVVIFYSAFGGIKSVTFTDVIQFITFGVFIPMFALFIWQAFGDMESITNTLRHNPLFDYQQALDYSNPKFWPCFFLFLYFMVPGVNSTLFQRTLMAKSTKQIAQSFGIAAIVTLFIHCFSCFIGLVVFAHNPSIDPNNIMIYAVDNYSFTGLRGFAVIGVMAMVMSTADSWLNTASVIFSHDLCKPLGINSGRSELWLSRLFTICIGLIAILLVSTGADLLQLILFSGSFYRPIITVPLILAILGFRSSTKALCIGMIGGGVCVIIWKNFITPLTGINSVFPAMATNLICFMGSHYLLRQKGGWVGIKDDQDLQQIRQRRNRSINSILKFFINLPSFSFAAHCNKSLPKIDAMYSYFGCCSLLSIVTSFAMDKTLYLQNSIIINTLQIVSLFIGTTFFCRKLLFGKLFASKAIGLIWYASIFISLSFISSFLVIMSGFSHISLIVFILSLTTIGVLLTWQAALGMMITGAIIAFYTYQNLIGTPTATETHDLELQIVYALFLVGGFMIAFLKPKQDRLETADEKIDYLLTKLDDQKEEIFNALELKNEFLRNLQHESHTPITGITSMAQAIDEGYDKISEESRRKAIRGIAMSTDRLLSYVDNLIDVSKLSSLKCKLNNEKINLSDMVNSRLEKCIKLYIEDNGDGREFIVSIQEGVIIKGDRHYLERTIDNLVVNAIQYCVAGKITILLSQDSRTKVIEFSIADEGIGIPVGELQSIFGTFTVSSRTKTPAGGRGVGLALCKKVIELHNGEIVAESDGGRGSVFKVTLPPR